MHKQTKTIIFSLILAIAFSIKYCSPDSSTSSKPNYIKPKKPNKTITYYPQPENGYSPYNAYFGRGIYNNNTQNAFIIKIDNRTDAVVLLVDANSNRKIRNEYIRKGNTFSFSGTLDTNYTFFNLNPPKLGIFAEVINIIKIVVNFAK